MDAERRSAEEWANSIVGPYGMCYPTEVERVLIAFAAQETAALQTEINRLQNDQMAASFTDIKRLLAERDALREKSDAVVRAAQGMLDGVHSSHATCEHYRFLPLEDATIALQGAVAAFRGRA